MTELDRLETYLAAKKIPYERYDEAGKPVVNRHQIVVFEDEEHILRSWDAICQYGSYGFEEGLLEVMGKPVVRASDGDEVCGYLTARDVIERLEKRKETKANTYVFTFGCGQKHAGNFVRISGTADEARDRMVELFGYEWCMQYTEEEWKRWTDLAYSEGIPVETEMELPKS